ncbi:hypothetical protein [Streptomyces bohaiensis]|uniref:Uncharacterized protein n=1 Tax=Streptomyces bohaiensis TaxID=1431344 RepID=A0ABX1C4P9_9ACTN|nr:hypothetical protein [Streptomyces bohaiensis]NJQ14196.1 hypothetical protein [Streptomyces bohaiensis]
MTHVLTLPAGLRLLSSNERVHYRRRAEITAAIRAAAMAGCSEHPGLRAAMAAVPAGHPAMDHAYILGVLHPGSRRRIDPANFYPSFKAAVDGLVDAGLLADDDHTRVVGPDMRLGPISPRVPRISLVITELTAAEHAAFAWGQAAPAV